MSDLIYPVKQYHYLLEITVNNRIYVCKHSNYIPIDQDDYTGSGDVVRRYVKMFGSKAREKLLAGRKVLFECATEEEAFEKEGEVVTWKFVRRKDTLNKVAGGKGGHKGAKRPQSTVENCRKARQKLIEETDIMTKIAKSLTGRKATKEHCENVSKALMGRKLSPEHNRNKALAQSGLNHPGLKKRRKEFILWQEPYLSEIMELRNQGLGKQRIKNIMDVRYPALEYLGSYNYQRIYESYEKFGF